MRKYLISISLTILLLGSFSACSLFKKGAAGGNITAKQVLKLQMTNGDGLEGDGSNGAGVAYHKSQRKYYAYFAGNSSFPMRVFDDKGSPLSDYIKTWYDARGIWYNPLTNQLEGNGYDDEGIVSFGVGKDGLPNDKKYIFEGLDHQPDANCVGAFDYQNNEILYYYDGEIYRYDRKTGAKIGTWVFKKDLNPYEINENVVIYTGLPNREVGVLNYQKKEVLLFDIRKGEQTATVKLPANAPTLQNFNFSYANGIYWVFDKENRCWLGYK